MTDTERLDFLERQSFTKWVGFDMPNEKNAQTVWPIFDRGALRAAIDQAIAEQQHWAGRAPQEP